MELAWVLIIFFEMKKDDYGFYGKGIDGYVHY